MKYEVKIVETRQRFVEVEADDKRDALLVAARKYIKGEFDMEPSKDCSKHVKLFGASGNPNMLDLAGLSEGVK